MSNPTFSDPILEEALNECHRTYVGPGLCTLWEHLLARYEFHRLLVERKMLDPKHADRYPDDQFYYF
jgi:hypothetical protein